MSDKKLLEESVVRRFQALANIKPIANGLVEEGKMNKKVEEKKKVREEKKKLEEDTDIGSDKGISAGQTVFREAEEMGMDMGGEAPEMGAGTEGGDEGGDVKAEVQALVDALNGLLEKVGQGELEVDVEAGGEEAGETPEAGKEEEEEGAPMEESFLEEAEELEETYHEEKKVEEALDIEIDDEEYLAEELTKRVAARLVAEMKKAKAMKEGKKGAAGSVAAASGKTGTSAAPRPKAKGSPTKGKVGTPFHGGKSKK